MIESLDADTMAGPLAGTVGEPEVEDHENPGAEDETEEAASSDSVG